MSNKLSNVLQELVKHLNDNEEALQKLKEYVSPDQQPRVDAMIHRLETIGTSVLGTQQVIKENKDDLEAQEAKSLDPGPVTTMTAEPTQETSYIEKPVVGINRAGDEIEKLKQLAEAYDSPQPSPNDSSKEWSFTGMRTNHGRSATPGGVTAPDNSHTVLDLESSEALKLTLEVDTGSKKKKNPFDIPKLRPDDWQ